MKSFILIVSATLLPVLGVVAEDLTNLQGRVFSGATIIRAEPDGLNVRHDGGITKLYFWELSPDVQARYGYDPKKAEAYAKQSAQAQAKYRKQVQAQPTELEQRAQAFAESSSLNSASNAAPNTESPATPAEPPAPFSTRVYSADEIFKNMFDLEGKVIRIEFPTANVRQESKEFYSANVGSGALVAVVLIPVNVGRAWFKEKNPKMPPDSLYVQVATGTLVNEFGTEEPGPILTAVGSSVFKSLTGQSSYRW